MSNTLNATYDLNKNTLFLLNDEPFFGTLSREMSKYASDSCPTAGVMVNKHSGYFEMEYNPKFWMSLDAQEGDKDEIVRRGRKGDKQLLLMHEFYHCLFGHVTTRVPGGGLTATWNVATDLAINGELFSNARTFSKDPGSLYDIGVIPGKPESPFAKYPVGLTADAYYEMLKKDPKFDPKDYEDGYGFDSHGGFGEVTDEMKIIAEQRIKSAAAKAVSEALGNGWGSVSNSMRKQIMDLLKSTIDWKKVLRYFVKTSQRSSRKTSIMRLNKRHPFVFPGYKTSRQAHVAIAIDQSGSVCDEMLASFFAELNGLSNVADFTVIPFDTRVDETKIFRWKKNQRVKTERVLSGGTCFNAPTDYVNTHGGFDGLIILTDLQAAKPGPCSIQRMWGTDERNAQQPYFTTNERIMVIKKDGNK